MKYIASIVFSAFFALTVTAQVRISGTFTNVPAEMNEVKIAFLRGKGLAVKHTAELNDGQLDFTWDYPERGIFIAYFDENHSFDFLISDGAIELAGDFNDLLNTEIKGAGNDEFSGFKDLLQTKPEEKDIRSYLLGVKNEHLRDFLLPQIMPFTSDDPAHIVRSTFWDYTNLSSPSTLINPFFEKNRNTYFDYILGHQPDTIIKYLNATLTGPIDEDVKRTLVSAATYHYESSNFMGEDKVFVWLVQQYYKTGFADWVEKDDLAKIIEKADGLSTELIGNPAPRFAFNTAANSKYGWTEGQRIKMESVQSPITILYFWDSTCGHCKKETPKLKAFYDEYKDKGVEIITLTLEGELSKWNAYRSEHKLDWICGYEEDFDRPNFLWYYYIPATPKKLVLDKDKNIIAKNLDTETTLRTFIDDYLAGKVK